MKILVLNAGSSSQKSRLYSLGAGSLPERPPAPVWRADIDWKGEGRGTLSVRSAGEEREHALRGMSRKAALKKMLRMLLESPPEDVIGGPAVEIAGHRVVHGGEIYTKPALVTKEVEAVIRKMSPLAPAHNPAQLEGVRAVRSVFGAVPQIAVFDTAFHQSMPREGKIYPIPYKWFERGIRRYGFHGISHSYCANRAAVVMGRKTEGLRVVVCHLGNGCSLAAVKSGRCVETTMGFTPLEGLMMGTRSGSIDPAIVLHLQRRYRCSAAGIEKMLNDESGLKGISGLSGDMRVILAAMAEGDERAALALTVYLRRLRSAIGAMCALLGGIDALVFTGGVGENAPLVRERACDSLEFLGLKIDGRKNRSGKGDRDIARKRSKVRVLVLHTEEDWAIARECHFHAGSGRSRFRA